MTTARCHDTRAFVAQDRKRLTHGKFSVGDVKIVHYSYRTQLDDANTDLSDSVATNCGCGVWCVGPRTVVAHSLMYHIPQFSQETFHALIVPFPQPTTRLAQDDSHGSSSAVLQRSFCIFSKGRRLQRTQCHHKWSVPHPVTRLLVQHSDLRAALLIDNPTREALVSALLSDIGSCKPGSTSGRLHHTGTRPPLVLRPCGR